MWKVEFGCQNLQIMHIRDNGYTVVVQMNFTYNCHVLGLHESVKCAICDHLASVVSTVSIVNI